MHADTQKKTTPFSCFLAPHLIRRAMAGNCWWILDTSLFSTAVAGGYFSPSHLRPRCQTRCQETVEMYKQTLQGITKLVDAIPVVYN